MDCETKYIKFCELQQKRQESLKPKLSVLKISSFSRFRKRFLYNLERSAQMFWRTETKLPWTIVPGSQQVLRKKIRKVDPSFEQLGLMEGSKKNKTIGKKFYEDYSSFRKCQSIASLCRLGLKCSILRKVRDRTVDRKHVLNSYP